MNDIVFCEFLDFYNIFIEYVEWNYNVNVLYIVQNSNNFVTDEETLLIVSYRISCLVNFGNHLNGTKICANSKICKITQKNRFV